MAELGDRTSEDPRVREAARRYWASNRRLVAGLLLVWAFVSLGCGVLLADWWNQWSIGGCPLGFWFAQQGAILVFVLLVFVYAVQMSRLDRHHRRELDRLRGPSASRTDS